MRPSKRWWKTIAGVFSRFLSRRSPPFTRVLFVESGSRAIAAKVLPFLYDRHAAETVDLITCFEGAPATFRDLQGNVRRSFHYPDRHSRRQLVRELRARRYDIIAMICSGEPYLAGYKLALAALLPAKILVINENADYFWFDRSSLRLIGKLFAARAGLDAEGSARTFAQIVSFPFALLVLLGFAARVHLMRQVRLILHSHGQQRTR